MPEPDIAHCHACGSPMDVSAFGPFTRVECPSCGEQTRVKCEFGPYTLLRRHAIGGMSMVFVAQDHTLEREVVVKILSEEFSADERRIGAFEEEARITASISHPHVVRVLTTGRAFGRFYIAMEFVPGGHYEHHIREKGSIPEAEALPLAIQVAEGLNAAHKSGLIHRDVKPGNILLDASGQAKIVDFGLALVTKGGKAQASEIWATPYYVPPETIEGLEEDFRSDLYAFGATFYHALAGKPPCDEESMDTKRLREAKRRIEPLEKAAPSVSPATCAVIDRCMAYAPDDRFGSYEEVIAALKSAQQMLAAGSTAPPATPGSGRRGRRGEGSGIGEKLAVAGAALAVVGALVVAGFWFMNPPEPAVEIDDEPPVIVAEPNPEPVESAGSGGLRVAEAYRQAAAALGQGDYPTARRLFGEVRDDPDALEPTASWAACEAVIAAYLEGESSVARQEAAKALEHLRSSPDLSDPVREVLEPALVRCRELPFFPMPEAFEDRGPEPLAWMLAGLKNWEQGGLDVAAPFFRAVLADPSNPAWLPPYRKLAQAYLDDLDRLRKGEPKSFLLSPAECLALVDELHALHSTLSTKGRARFNVRCWQLELEKRARSQPVTPVVEPAPEPWPEQVDRDLAACRFVEAVEGLKAWTPSDDAGTAKRASLVTLAEAAASFLAELSQRAVAAGDPVELETRDGRRFVGITGGDASRVSVLASDRTESSVAWGEIDPDSVIDLHRTLLSGSVGEGEQLRRNEQAVAYDFLAGNRQRALLAVERLGKESEAFERRWKELLAGLQP